MNKVVLVTCALLGLAGCQKGTSPEPPAAQDEPVKQGVTLSADQVAKLGIATQPAGAVDYTPEVMGFGLVVPHDAIAAAVAEVTTAQAAQAQSRAAAARSQRLAGTPGAMSADATETSTRQLATDSAALALAERRLSSVIGAGPFAAEGSALQDLASGKVKLLHATFPLGALPGATPASLRAAHLESGSAGAARKSGWSLHPVWTAPADASLPGRSFFALLQGSDAGEGERLLVWAPGSGSMQRGVAVPAAALVISEGRYWCYVETKPGVFERREVATDRPTDAGYVITQGVVAGEHLVTAAAGLLLARELNPDTGAD